MRWLDRFLATRMPRIYSLLNPIGALEVAFAELKPGYYILVMDARVISLAQAAKIGWPRLGEGSEVKLQKVLVKGNPKDVVALWRAPGAVEVLE